MSKKKPFHVINTLLVVFITMLLSISTSVYAASNDFHSPYFDISLADNLKFISKSEEKANGFYSYVFASSNSNDDTKLQMRVLIANKKPAANQSLEDFQTTVLGTLVAISLESDKKLYQYASTPENQKVLSQKPDQLKLGNASFAGATMYFGNVDASFLVTSSQDMTYGFILLSQSSNEQLRKNNLKMLTQQLQSIKFNSVPSN